MNADPEWQAYIQSIWAMDAIELQEVEDSPADGIVATARVSAWAGKS